MSDYYTHPPEHLKHIIELAHDWEKTKTKLKYVKMAVRDQLAATYYECCYYCKMPLHLGSNPGDIEHIVHKGNENYKEFTFHPLNLTLTCKKCNTAKGVEETLKSEKQNIKYKYEDYPRGSDNYDIVHTHFDNYYEHLELNKYIFTNAKDNSEKGIKTIEICNLYRLDLALSRVKRYKYTYGMGGPAKELAMRGSRSEEEILQELRKFFEEEDINRFQALCAIGGNSVIFQMVNELAKVEDVILITLKDNFMIFELFMKNFEIINQYYEFIYYINKKKTLLKETQRVIRDEHLLKEDSSKIILNHVGIEKLNESLSKADLRLQESVIQKLKEHLLTFEPSHIPIIVEILQKKDLLLKLVKVVSDILLNQQIKDLLPGLEGFDFMFVNQEIEGVKDHIDRNPHLNLVSHLEWYYHTIMTGINRDTFFTNKKKISTIIDYFTV
ncbi:hypothetical protein [Mesobacillus foraminis]|uniref:hypothetical protein n=1 Tax=Mesobacillus foraminis TaxID=279826 RepID=UPI000EF545F7|nr:hypothetical protein [Mesobacillus foraminis]